MPTKPSNTLESPHQYRTCYRCGAATAPGPEPRRCQACFHASRTTYRPSDEDGPMEPAGRPVRTRGGIIRWVNDDLEQLSQALEQGGGRLG